ncbi:unnamed protein product [Mytilus coruscus]|uniref:CCHC-type domain-containing protein n=1 Tax=Mytilus coruscus TaxID=42192 RepID=A0A6J8CHX5_MYTCO|nr:unnamed protein product [Mytilus coruscus]
MALTKITEQFGELRTEIENKQRKINEVTKEAAENTKKITTEFEDKIKILKAKLTTSEENNYKAERVQENIKKQVSVAIDQCNREREENIKLQTIILNQDQDLETTKRNKDMATDIEQSDKQSANAVRKGGGKRRNGPRFLQTHTDQKVKKKTTCRNCGGDFPHANKCPAFGKSCNSCKKMNHFAAVCRSKRNGTNTYKRKVNKVENYEYDDAHDSSSDDGYIFGLRENTVNKVQKGQPKINVKINNSNVDILIDTGSSMKAHSRTSSVNQNFLTPTQEYSHMDQIQT